MRSGLKHLVERGAFRNFSLHIEWIFGYAEKLLICAVFYVAAFKTGIAFLDISARVLTGLFAIKLAYDIQVFLEDYILSKNEDGSVWMSDLICTFVTVICMLYLAGKFADHAMFMISLTELGFPGRQFHWTVTKAP